MLLNTENELVLRTSKIRKPLCLTCLRDKEYNDNVKHILNTVKDGRRIYSKRGTVSDEEIVEIQLNIKSGQVCKAYMYVFV